MKLDFEQLRKLSCKLHQDWTEDGDICEQLDKGDMVYSISFEPSTGACRAHVQWPYFRNLVANEADHPATYTTQYDWLHLSCTSHGVEIVTCLEKAEIVNMLKELVAEHPEGDYEVCEDDDIINLFTIWQNMTGWDLNWPSQQEVQPNG